MFALFTYILLFSGVDISLFPLIFPLRGLKKRSVCPGDPRVLGGFRTPLVHAAAVLQGYPYLHHAALDINRTTCTSRHIQY